MKDNPDLRWCKKQTRQRMDPDVRVAAAPPLVSAPKKRAQRRRCDARTRRNPASLERAKRADRQNCESICTGTAAGTGPFQEANAVVCMAVTPPDRGHRRASRVPSPP